VLIFNSNLFKRDLGSDDITVNTTGTFSSDDSEVSFLSPTASPGVLDNPVRSVTIDSVSDEEDSVVELLRVANPVEPGIEDTPGVELKRSGVNGNGKRAIFKEELLDHIFVLAGGIAVSGYFGLDFGSIEAAFSISSAVRVVLFSHHSRSLQVFEGVFHQTSIATLIDFVAVN
jgi:hypothetical protein